jgi:hypothetical protein
MVSRIPCFYLDSPTCPFVQDTFSLPSAPGSIAKTTFPSNTVFTMRTTLIFVLLLSAILAGSAAAQQRVFDWTPATDESVRLDPAYYHAGHTFHPGPQGGNIHVDIQSNLPVTIAMAPEADWNQAVQHPELLASLHYLCMQEHVVKSTYVCELPPQAMILLVRDERNNPDNAVFAGLGAVLNSNDKTDRAIGVGIETLFTGPGSSTRRFVAPNDLHIQYYRWVCVRDCFPPEFQWIRQLKEKYELTSYLKVYGGFAPQRDGEQVSVKIKSPVPMIVAMLPSAVADQLHSNPQALENALEKNSCQQRGVQSLQFQCTFNAADGPQSLIVVPESSSVPNHKKAEIEMLASKCVANCVTPKPGPAAAPAVTPATSTTPAASPATPVARAADSSM